MSLKVPDVPSPVRRRPWEVIAEEFHCDHPVTDLRSVVFTNGQVNYVRQCMRCGEKASSYLKHSTLNDRQKATVLPFDPEVGGEWREARKSRQNELQAKEFIHRQREWSKQLAETSDDFWSRYEEYLSSDQWAIKRKAVLNRDDHLCQACLHRPATQAHHLSYKHVFDEPLFDLVAVCIPCHKKITQRDREAEKW
jgi:5-methylcytosine-specific restriction endonuclease McrA